MLHVLQVGSLFCCNRKWFFVKFMNTYANWMMFKTNLNLWNVKPMLAHLIYETAMLCFKCVQDRFHQINLVKPGYEQAWMRLTWLWEVSLIGHALVMCLEIGLWKLYSCIMLFQMSHLTHLFYICFLDVSHFHEKNILF